ncbi:MAG TPA: DMT family transporter [Bauldia sp.]|nr:DMT family transporter [Bauldia sp.]
MSAAVFVIVLFAAACHAVWNAIVKNAPDSQAGAVLVAGCAGVISAIALPFVPVPAAASWPYLAAALVLHTVYYTLVGKAYRAADMSQAYPLMRGTAPLIVAVVTAFWLGEALSVPAWAGVVLVSSGVLTTALGVRRGDSFRGVALALLNALVIAGYTINDGLGVRVAGSAAGYIMWLSLAASVPLIAREIISRPGYFRAYATANLHLGLIGGAGTLVSYGLALWAMTQAPVAIVAALRETAIVFATGIAVFVLHEKVTPARLAAIALIGLGTVALKLA